MQSTRELICNREKVEKCGEEEKKCRVNLFIMFMDPSHVCEMIQATLW